MVFSSGWDERKAEGYTLDSSLRTMQAHLAGGSLSHHLIVINTYVDRLGCATQPWTRYASQSHSRIPIDRSHGPTLGSESGLSRLFTRCRADVQWRRLRIACAVSPMGQGP